MIPGLAVPASTLRRPKAVGTTAVAQWTTQLSALTCRQFAGVLFHPVSNEYMKDTFGVDVHMAARVYADAVQTTENFPVEPGDKLVLGGASYAIRGVRIYGTHHMELFIDLQPSH